MTIINLMLHGFCLLICSTPVLGQSFTVTERTQLFTVTNRVESVAPDYVVMFTASYCGPCRTWKAQHAETLKRAGYPVTFVDVTQQPQWGVTRVPTFWVCDGERQTKKREWIGSVSAETLLQAITPCNRLEVIRSNFDPQRRDAANDSRPLQHHAGSPAVDRFYSQSELIRIHNRLHGGGNWTWPGDLKTHLEATHGWKK